MPWLWDAIQSPSVVEAEMPIDYNEVLQWVAITALALIVLYLNARVD